MIFGRFKKKRDEEESLPVPMESSPDLPEDLERFRIKQPESRPPTTDYPVPEVPSYGKSVEELVSERTSGDKIELILQKLETIDARLRLIEEKIKRY